jgi:hypothetical protein
MNEILETTLLITIQVFLPIILSAVVAFIVQKYKEIKSTIPVAQYELIVALAHQFVLAAEQQGLSGMIAKEGIEKKAWVLGRLDAELKERGISVNVQHLSDVVEAAVFEVLNQYK